MLGVHASLSWSDDLRLGFFAQNLLNDQGFANPWTSLGWSEIPPKDFRN